MRAARRAVGMATRAFTVGVAVDTVAVMTLLSLVACAFWPVYATGWLLVTVLGFGVVGAAVALTSTHRGWSFGATALATVVVWFLFGGFLTMPSSSWAWVVPTPRTLFGLLTGPVTAWRDMLTLDPPIGETFNLLTVPGLVSLLGSLVTVSIAARNRVTGLVWVPLAITYVVGVVVGSRVAFQPMLVGVVFFLVVLIWTSYRRSAARAQLSGSGVRLRPVRLAAGLAAVLASVLMSMTLVPAIAGSVNRDNLRAVMEPPIDLSAYASPLQGYRANITQHRESTLFHVLGARSGDIVRLATLDKYDGMSYRVGSLEDEALEATTFTRVGQWIADEGSESVHSVAIDVVDYEGVWVPTLGRTTSISFEGGRTIALGESFFYNRASSTGFVSTGLSSADRYELESKVPARPLDDDIAQARAGSYPLPAVTGVPSEVVALARRWTQEAPTAGAAALQIERELRKGYFSHGQPDEAKSLPGHTENRLSALLNQPGRMVGDHEQYAVAMALMARELGIPARVIYGYRVQGSNVTGNDVGAWPELYFESLGWVMFDPTPPEEQKLDLDEPLTPPNAQPFVENPPPPPRRPAVPLGDELLPINPGDPPANERPIDWAQIGVWFALTAIPLVTIVLPIALVVWLKLRRRKRRREHPVMANRIAGAWAELVDYARDLGRSPSVAATRSEQAEALLESFPKLYRAADPVSLALEADWIVFAPGEPTQEVTHRYWGASGMIRRGMRESVSKIRWALSRLSTKSFRRIK